jgi:hypothetical protein
MTYRPNRHYWIIGGSGTEVYYSGDNTMKPVADATYTAWLTAQTDGVPNAPTPIADIEALRAVIQPLGLFPEWLMKTVPTFIQPAIGIYSKEQLKSYTAVARSTRAGGGMIVTSLSPVSFQSDPLSRNTVNSAYDYALTQTGAWTINWKMTDNSFVTLDKTKITTLMSSMSAFVQTCYTCENTTDANIDSGTITTSADRCRFCGGLERVSVRAAWPSSISPSTTTPTSIRYFNTSWPRRALRSTSPGRRWK